ncbi:hypothetical protein DF186_14375 [Enterococcus hirae]|nr:hypothetical protein DF186_14375 [Enterococcus hirae]
MVIIDVVEEYDVSFELFFKIELVCLCKGNFFLKIMFCVLELLYMDIDVGYCVFGDCICFMYYLIDSNDYGCWFG